MPLGKNLQFLSESVPKYRRVFLQGGSRSGKSYAIIHYLISLAAKYNGLGVISICRESYNALKATAMRDFFDILIDAGLYREQDYNRTDHIYRLNGNTFEFFGLDSPGKVQGRKRDILFVNEIMETDYRVYKQLVLRTTGKIIGDFNPTEIEHWVYDEIARPDAAHLVSTYKDNPHLNEETIAEIEFLQQADPDLWRIYGEGMPATVRNQVYSHYSQRAYQVPDERAYGLDFGYNHPTVLVEVGSVGDSVQWHEMIYQSHLTIPDLIRLMKESRVDRNVMIYADGARPEAIEDIQRAGYRIRAVEKYPGSVKEQILKVKSRPLIITSESVNLKREIKSYKWSDNSPDDPVKAFDDGMDAGRYGSTGIIRSKVIGAKINISRKKTRSW
jgi:phage terminase large subunit